MHGVKKPREKLGPYKIANQGDTNGLIQCEICGKSYKRKSLKNHNQVVHEKIKRKKYYCSGICDQCGIFFKDLPGHKKHKHVTQDDPLTCKTCGRTFLNKYVLQIHERDHVKIPCK